MIKFRQILSSAACLVILRILPFQFLKSQFSKISYRFTLKMRISSKSCRLFLKELYLHLVGVLVSIFVIILLVLFIPTFIFRPIANLLRKVFRPDLVNILSTISSSYAQADDEDSAKTIIVIQISFHGIVTYEHILKTFQKRILDCKEPNGNWRYSELRQYITNWMGYKFWKWESKFDIRDHITAIEGDNSNLSAKDLNEIGDKLMAAPFKGERSPWEVLIIPGVLHNSEERTFMFFRMNHALGDGYSILFILQKLFGHKKPQVAVAPKQLTPNHCYFLLLPFKILKVLGEMACNNQPSNIWRVPANEKSNQNLHHTGGDIPVDTIKRIKNKHGVSFTSVVYALIAGGVRNFLAEKGTKGNLPVSLPGITVVPFGSTHPDKLVNKFGVAISTFPVGEVQPSGRLQIIHNNFENARDSPVPLIGHWLCKLMGCNFNFVGKRITKGIDTPIYAGYFPVGDDWTLDGRKAATFTHYVLFSHGHVGAFFYISTFGGNLNVSSIHNAAVLQMEDIKRLGDLIEAEAQELLKDTPFLTKRKLQ